jgi:hypothetical protein
MNTSWHPKILPAEQAALLPRLAELPDDFILYGGTALALRLGHRTSVDFDFFSASPFVPDRLEANLPISGNTLQKEENTLSLLTASGVKISFFGGLKFGRVAEPDDFQSLRVASLDDLFATKLNTIYQRAEAKDYLDIAAILDAGLPLEHGLGAAIAIYGESFNYMLPLKALAWFGEPSLDKIPDAIKEKLSSAAADFTSPTNLTPISSSV